MEELLGEIWRPIKGTDKAYYISSFGRIYSTKSKKLLKTPVGKRGYPNCNIMINSKQKLVTIHRLVANHFISNPDNKPQVNHIDGDKTNNNITNLEWVTSQENIMHARQTGLHVSDGDKSVNQLKDGIIIATYKSISEASRKTGINRGNINQCCLKHRRYKTAGGYEWEYAK